MRALTKAGGVLLEGRAVVKRPDPVLSTPTLFLTNTDVGVTWLYWTRPYPNPDATGPDDAYLWLGSSDHAGNGQDNMYRGYSASPDVAPTSWTIFQPNSAGDQQETPCFVYVPGHVRPYWLYYHPNSSPAPNNQQSKLITHTSPAWENGTEGGWMLPGSGFTPILDHTGYMWVERGSANDWHAWSFTRSEGTHGRAEYGHWTATNGTAWTCVNDDLDVRSMLEAGRMLVLRCFQPFWLDGVRYAITTEHPDNTETGAADPDPGGKVVLIRVPDRERFEKVAELWEPADLGLTDDLRDVRAFQDEDNPRLIHLYIHCPRTHVYHATLTMDGG